MLVMILLSILKNDNASLIAKIDKLNESLSSLKIENDKLISKAKDLNVCNDAISSLKNENAILRQGFFYPLILAVK